MAIHLLIRLFVIFLVLLFIFRLFIFLRVRVVLLAVGVSLLVGRVVIYGYIIGTIIARCIEVLFPSLLLLLFLLLLLLLLRTTGALQSCGIRSCRGSR